MHFVEIFNVFNFSYIYFPRFNAFWAFLCLAATLSLNDITCTWSYVEHEIFLSYHLNLKQFLVNEIKFQNAANHFLNYLFLIRKLLL